MKKRGASHIEMVIAAVIFVSFVIFALIFFSPADPGRLVDATMIYTFDEIIDNTTLDVIIYSISIHEDFSSSELGLRTEGVLVIDFPTPPYCDEDNDWCEGADVDFNGYIEIKDKEVADCFFGLPCSDYDDLEPFYCGDVYLNEFTIERLSDLCESDGTLDAETFSLIFSKFGGEGLTDVIVHDYQNQADRYDSYRDKNNVYLKHDSDVIQVVFSEGIDEEQINIIPSLDSDKSPEPYREYYDIASSEKKQILSEKRMEELKTSYESDYVQLKKDFNLPGRVQFAFELQLPEKTISPEYDIPAGLEVFTESKRIEVLRETAELEFADLIIKIW